MVDVQVLAMEHELARSRDVLCRVAPRDAALDDVAAADAIAVAVGFRAIGDEWVEIDRELAKERIAIVLGCSLVYDVEILPPLIARAYAQRFVTELGEARYFTNGSPGAWMPVTDATFDAGVVAVGRERAGILWVRDED